MSAILQVAKLRHKVSEGSGFAPGTLAVQCFEFWVLSFAFCVSQGFCPDHSKLKTQNAKLKTQNSKPPRAKNHRLCRVTVCYETPNIPFQILVDGLRKDEPEAGPCMCSDQTSSWQCVHELMRRRKANLWQYAFVYFCASGSGTKHCLCSSTLYHIGEFPVLLAERSTCDVEMSDRFSIHGSRWIDIPGQNQAFWCRTDDRAATITRICRHNRFWIE